MSNDGFFSEEIKIMKESRKILRMPDLKISAMAVRVPVMNSHAEAVWVTLKRPATRSEVIKVLEESQGVVVQDDPAKSIYPLQAKASGQDPVFVGRIHADPDDPTTYLMWIVSDNVRKGAALNGIQIAEQIFQ